MLGRFTKREEQKAEPTLEIVDEPSSNDQAVVEMPTTYALPEDQEVSREFTEMKVRLHQRLLEELNLSAIEKLSRDEFQQQVSGVIWDLLKAEKLQFNQVERQRIVEEVIDELVGLGPLEPLLKDPSVSDILVNTYSQVFIERRGRLELTPVHFRDDRHLMRIINRIVSQVGRRVDESQPLVDARLLDGSRVNAVVPPIAVDGPLVSIRKFAKIPFTMEKLVESRAIAPQIAKLLQGIVMARQNVIVSGGTGTGKTTLLNSMSRYIDGRERIVTIEDAAELQLQQIHIARLETRPPNLEGKGEIRQRELVKNSLRMRPDRIILGECRAGEAFDMLQAMNTGHEGSMTTIHSNSCRDALMRLENMIGMAGLDMPTRTIRYQIASAINFVVQLQRMSDGTRKVVSVSEITGMEGEIIQMQEIYKFVRTHVDDHGKVHGEFRATGTRPKVMEEFRTRGIDFPTGWLSPDKPLSWE